MQAATASRQRIWLYVVLLTLGGLGSWEEQSRQGSEAWGIVHFEVK
jgi:hypothetical protein